MKPLFKLLCFFFLSFSLCFIKQAKADAVCVKKNIKVGKKLNFAQTMKVTKSKCPKGYKKLYDIPKGERGPQGIQGVKGDRGAQGPKGAKGEKGDQGSCSCSGNPALVDPDGYLISGTTVTGQGNSGTFSGLAPIPITLNDVLVNYLDKKHPECTGSIDNPTAAPGKVCIYSDNPYSSRGCGSHIAEPKADFETISNLSRESCLSRAGYRWIKKGFFEMPGRRIDDPTICDNNFNYYSEDYICGGGEGRQRSIWSLEKCYRYIDFRLQDEEEIYWSGSKCLTRNGDKEVYYYEYGASSYEDNSPEAGYYPYDNEGACLSYGKNGYTNIPVLNGKTCKTSETNEVLYFLQNFSEPFIMSNTLTFGKCSQQTGAYIRVDLSAEECLGFSGGCLKNDGQPYCVEGSRSGFSTWFRVGDNATWAYTVP